MFSNRSALRRGAGFLRRVGYYRGRGTKHGCGGKELKFHDLDIDDAAIATNGNIAQVSCLTIVQGDGESERIGRKICVKKIGWRFEILKNTAGDLLSADVVRVILYLDQQTNGATAAVSGDGGIVEADDYQTFLNLANKGRFKIMMDRTYDMNTFAGAGNGTANDSSPVLVTDSFYWKGAIPIEYDSGAATGVITTMRSNNIGVLLFSRGGLCTFGSKMRIRFTD